MNPNRPQPQQRLEIPAANIPITGIRAESVILRHNNKLQSCPFDAGLDLYPTIIEKVTNHGHLAIIWCCTGIALHVSPGWRGIITGRSSSIDRLNGGEIIQDIIDAGYQGEFYVRVRVPNNMGIIEHVKKSIAECVVGPIAIAQFIIEQSLAIVPFVPPTQLPPTQRGPNGFGSTDRK